MYTKVKGTFDLLPNEAKKVAALENFLKEVANIYGYEEIRVPILSQSELIHRSSGESSDIVTKETFDFKDRGDRLLTLRPEGTAPVIRAVIENKMYTSSLPLKLFYVGDMFRYERPQKGRYREFSQFGVEVVGTNSPYMDAEVITLASTIFSSLHINNFQVRLNTLGDDVSRENYKNALKDYFSDKLDGLCADCKRRFETNPLRILDCKVDKDSDIFKNVPSIKDYLSDESKAQFELVKAYLDSLHIPYIVDDKLVRGLDYYTNTIFEVELLNKEEGQSSTICAGGRYDNLVKTLGGPDLGCVGFAFGLERLSAIVNDQYDYTKRIMCQFIPIGVKAKVNLVSVMQGLRLCGFSSEMNYEATNLKGHFKSSDNNYARFLIIQGDDELEKGLVKVKDKETNKEETISENNLITYLMNILNKSHHCSCDDGCDCDDNECHCHDDDHECHCHDEGHECHCHDEDHECHCHDEDHECHCHDDEDFENEGGCKCHEN